MLHRHTPRLLALLLLSPLALAAQPDWVKRSNQFAQPVMAGIFPFMPEMGSRVGMEQFDTEVIDLKPGLNQRRMAAMETQLARLQQARQAEQDRKVQQDLDIMVDRAQAQINSARLQESLLLSPINAAEIAINGLQGLLDPRNSPQRQARALTRLKRYAGLEAGYTPLTELAKARMEEELNKPGLTGPHKDELLQELESSAHMIKGIEALLSKSKLEGWQEPYAALAKQLRDYQEWTRSNVLPRARQQVQAPAAIYADSLKMMGVDIGPEELIERASAEFQAVREQMQDLASQVAKERKLPNADYRAVMLELKKKQLDSTAILPMYWQRLKDIETIVRREKIITLPDRKPNIRLATEAETAQTPAPHMNPPRMLGNTGEYGEFVLPLNNPYAKSGAKMDDFTHEAVTWTLAAHEARPGHELQFAAMVENGTSIARQMFAMNSANTEGWGLYSEALLLPYMPTEGKLFSLQARMQRVARAFLDPMVNLGRITPEQAKKVLMEEVGLSEPMSQQEVDRYAFRSPGQATSYYYGYLNMRSLRTQAELALGKQFNLQAFNDFVIAQGALPPRLLKQAVLNEFVPTQLANSAKLAAK